MHRSDFQLSINPNQTTLNPGSYRMAWIVQNRMFRWKQIWCHFPSSDFNGTGLMDCRLNFWQGSVPPIPPFTSFPTPSQAGLLMASIPIGAGRQGFAGTDLERGTHPHATPFTQARSSEYVYEHRLYTNRVYGTAQSFEIEIGSVDWMSIDVSWNANIFAPQALLAVIGSDHPPKMYHEYNFAG